MLVYVSGRYSGKTHKDIDKNIADARAVAIQLWEKGHAVLTPHLNTSHMEVDCKADYDAYMQGDLTFVSVSDAIVMLQGWEDSKGATREREYAIELGVPIYYAPALPELHPTEVRCPNQARAFREIVGTMYRTHPSKNASYSPANIMATGNVGVVVRAWDKVARILNLTGFHIEAKFIEFVGEKPATHEAIEDTWLDLAVYGIIGLLLRKGKWGN